MHGESHNIALGCVRCMFSLNVSYSPSPSLSPQQCLSCHSPYQISPPFLPPKTRRRRSVGRSVGGLACERRGRRQLQTVVGGISPGANELGQRERKERERERERGRALNAVATQESVTWWVSHSQKISLETRPLNGTRGHACSRKRRMPPLPMYLFKAWPRKFLHLFNCVSWNDLIIIRSGLIGRYLSTERGT